MKLLSITLEKFGLENKRGNFNMDRFLNYLSVGGYLVWIVSIYMEEPIIDKMYIFLIASVLGIMADIKKIERSVTKQ